MCVFVKGGGGGDERGIKIIVTKPEDIKVIKPVALCNDIKGMMLFSTTYTYPPGMD